MLAGMSDRSGDLTDDLSGEVIPQPVVFLIREDDDDRWEEERDGRPSLTLGVSGLAETGDLFWPEVTFRYRPLGDPDRPGWWEGETDVTLAALLAAPTVPAHLAHGWTFRVLLPECGRVAALVTRLLTDLDWETLTPGDLLRALSAAESLRLLEDDLVPGGLDGSSCCETCGRPFWPPLA